MRAKLKSAAAAVAVASAITVGSVGLAGEANASPYNCGWGWQSNGVVKAWCSSGTGQVAAVAGCKNIFNFYYTAVGPYVNIKTSQSSVSCPFGYSPQWGGYYLRG